MTVLTLLYLRPPRRLASAFRLRRTTNAANRIKAATPNAPTKQPSAK